MKRIGIYGGSFNPIHFGHLKNAEFIKEKFQLDMIFFVPVGVPTHRENSLLCGEDRIKLIKAAIKEVPGFICDDFEIREKKQSYTYDTLQYFQDKYPNSEFFEIIGEDSYNYLTEWKNYNELIKQCHFIVLSRMHSQLISNHEHIVLANNPIIALSASDIRIKITQGESLIGLMPPACIALISENKFYSKEYS